MFAFLQHSAFVGVNSQWIKWRIPFKHALYVLGILGTSIFDIQAQELGCISDYDGDGICDLFEVPGCTSPTALNYDLEATDDNGTCNWSGFFEGLWVEAIPNELADSIQTFRVYAEFNSPSIEIAALFGTDVYHWSLFSTEPFYQHPWGQLIGTTINPFFFGTVPELAFDTWLALGGEPGDSDDVLTVGMDDFFLDFESSGGNVEVNTEVGASIFYTPGASDLAYPNEGQILLGQFSTSGVVTLVMNLQYRDPCYTTLQVTNVHACFPAMSQDCTDPAACNFNPTSTDETAYCSYPETFYNCQGSCVNDADGDGLCDVFETIGCMDSTACNFNPYVNEDDDSCQFPVVEGIYSCFGTCWNDVDGDGVCDELEVLGCDDPLACNFDFEASENDGSCLYSDFDGDGICNEFEVPGCTIPLSCNYHPEATDDDGSCEFFCLGCMDEEACNFDASATVADESCLYPVDIHGNSHWDCDEQCLNDMDGDGICDEEEVLGCTNPEACNFVDTATDDDGSCLVPDAASCTICAGADLLVLDDDGDGVCNGNEVWGCDDPASCTFNTSATENDGSCLYPSDLCGYSHLNCECECANDSDADGICDEDEIAGCLDPESCNFDPTATDEGECETISCAGCIYPLACNFDPDALFNDGSCEFGTCPGCTDPAACNFNPTVTEDDGSCLEWDVCGICGGNGPDLGYTCDGNCIDSNADGICDIDESGCTDQEACNYNPLSSSDDGSCVYASGCMDCQENCWDFNVNGICDCEEVLGCMDAIACNFVATANVDDGTCVYAEPELDCEGNCLSDYDADGICDLWDDCPFDSENDADADGICGNMEIWGCTDLNACNYLDMATEDDGSCLVIENIEMEAYNSGYADGESTGYAEGYADGEGGLASELDAGNFCGDGTFWSPELGICLSSDCFADVNSDGWRGTADLLLLLSVFDTGCAPE